MFPFKQKNILAFVLVAILLMGCGDQQAKQAVPELIKVGVLPDENKDRLVTKYTPLIVHLSKSTGIPHTLVIPESYSDILSKFENKEIDIAYLGGATYIKAHLSSKATPLVFRDIDLNFTSLFIINIQCKEDDFADMKGKTFAFGSKLSTSGHFMPRFFLNEMRIDPESHFKKVLYSGAHDKTAYFVRDGKADMGVANAHVIRRLLKSGEINEEQIKIFWETPPYPDYVWVANTTISPEVANKIKYSMLNINNKTPAGKEILKNLSASGFLPARHKDFAPLEKIMRQLKAI